MKIAGLMPIGLGPEGKFRMQSFDQLRELSDMAIVLEDKFPAPQVVRHNAHEVITINHSQPWSCYSNRLMLLARAAANGCDWALWVDEDDQLDPRLGRTEIDAMIAYCEHVKTEPIVAIRFKVREMWNETHWRRDGVFGKKSRIVLQKNPLLMPSVTWKNHWNPHSMPVQEGEEFQSGWELFHWGMSTPELRAARVAKYAETDPDNRWQPEGFSYMTDETNMELVKANL
jgi:hypothetical protein